MLDFAFLLDLFVDIGDGVFVLVYLVAVLFDGALELVEFGFVLAAAFFCFAELAGFPVDLAFEVAGVVLLDFVVEILVFDGLVAVFFEVFEVAFAFFEDDFCFVEPVFYFLEFFECLLLLFFVNADAGNLLNNLPSLDGAHFDEADDVALENDVVPVGVDTGRIKEFDDFCPGGGFVVDFVPACAVVADDSADFDFVFVDREGAVVVVEDDADFGCF